MFSYALDWVNLIVRWLHFTAGIMWIGTSLYFVWLDNRLTAPRAEDVQRGISGELWSVHGGGFYHNQKYPTGPRTEPLTTNLHWFKWEAYTTWLSGMVMLALIYWVGARTYLIDTSVANLTPAAAIGISAASLIVGWVVYDTLCRLLSRQPLILGVAVFVFMTACAWELFHVFGARGAFIHVGAIIGTIMAANVAHVIIPGQRKMLADIRAGREPDPRPGALGKQRSVHNTYFTLPVLFIMISIHYPFVYASSSGWLALAIIGLAGVIVRYFFILTDRKRYVVALPLLALLLLAGVAIALAPRSQASSAAVSFTQVQPIIARRCAVCHAAKPTEAGYASAPAGVLLDSPAHIVINAQRIDQQAVVSQAMPLGNVTGITSDERALLGTWIAQGAKIK